MTTLFGDCRETLATLEDESVDSIVTDPPYEIGFMGKGWDGSGVANDPTLWAECFRVLKPGGHVLAFGATRTYHRMACAIEDAGFEIRDSIHWVYGSGFPKSHNVSKGIDKAAGAKRKVVGSRPLTGNGKTMRSGFHQPDGSGSGETIKQDILEITAAVTEDAIKWEGWGTALKPAHEPIVLARKPLIGTVTENVLVHNTGALNIDGTRIGTSGGTRRDGKADTPNAQGWANMKGHGKATVAAGRWPANVLLTHSIECEEVGSITDTFGGGRHGTSGFATGYAHDGYQGNTVDLPVSKCAPDCPAAEIDRQSGQTRGGTWNNTDGARYFDNDGKTTDYKTVKTDNTQGGASRFFAQLEWAPADHLASVYTPKAGKKERNAGLDGMPNVRDHDGRAEGKSGGDNSRNRTNTPKQNHHPTVKPVALMRYLIRLVTPPGGTVLDPFLGSGTTAVAAILEGYDWIGCELTAEYLPIIEARCEWANNEVLDTPLGLF